MTKRRKALLAGLWYPSDKRVLREKLDVLLEMATPHTAPSLGGVVPHAGLEYSGKGQASFFRSCAQDIRKVVLLSPSHHFHLSPNRLYWGAYGSWETPLGDIPGFLSEPEYSGFVHHDESIAQEHGLELIFPFLAKTYPRLESLECFIVPKLSDMSAASQLMELILQRLGSQGGVLLASSDFTHYGRRFDYEPFGRAPDPQVMEKTAASDHKFAGLLSSGNFQEALDQFELQQPTICGFYPALLASMVSREQGWAPSPGVYYNSQDITGTDSSFVTYHSLLFRKETALP